MNPNQKWVILMYMMATLFCIAFGGKLIEIIFGWVSVRDTMLLGNQFTLSNAIAVILCLVAAVGTYKNEQVNMLANEVVTEMRKVAWPTLKPWFSFKAEVWAGTYVVIITVFIVAVILGVFDMIWSWTTDKIYR